jgi:hypothetical protein
MANLARPAGCIFFVVTVPTRHLQEETSLFSWTCEALKPAFCVRKMQRNNHPAMRILLELP